MEPLETIVNALVKGADAAASESPPRMIRKNYTALKEYIVKRYNQKADIEVVFERIEAAASAAEASAVLSDALSKTDVETDGNLLTQARRFLAYLEKQMPVPAVSQTKIADRKIFKPSKGEAAAAGVRSVFVGGNAGGSIVTGDENIVAGENTQVQTGGIRAGRIAAENVVDGVQIQGEVSVPESIVALAKDIRSGGITAQEIIAKNLVSGLQYISDSNPPTVAGLSKEIAALKEQLRQAVASGELSDPDDADDANQALNKAEKELAKPEPQGSRVVRKLDEVSQIMTKTAETLTAAGKLKIQVMKLAPHAAALVAFARSLFGG